MPIPFDKIRLILSLLAVFTIPGWCFITITGLWQIWRPLQRWIIAIGASLAFYPILYYIARFILPGLHIGFNKNLVLLIIGLLITIYLLRRDWREQFGLDQYEVIALIIFGVTIFTRFWIIRGLPYPAWSDSLHHTLLTKLTAELGRLPYTLEPYSGASLDMYHLGLYAITGTVQQLSGAPAHTALLWTAQLLNGFCAIGIYFVLDRFVGRWAALTGITIAGLVSLQPAWYVNWGRFTQLASQTIMLVALGVTWQILENVSTSISKFSKLQLIGLVALASGLNAAVFLLHFRVAAYYFPFLIAIVLYELFRSVKKQRLRKFILSVAQIGGISLVLILPALIPAINKYIAQSTQEALLSQGEAYFGYSSLAFFMIGIRPLLFWIAIFSGVIALLFRHRILTIITWLWVLVLFFEGNLYKLGISFLRFTNFSGAMIGFYLPAAMLIGLGIETLADRVPPSWQNRFSKVFLYSIFLIGFIASFFRASGIESWRYFMNDYDRQAMDWINNNTSSSAVFAINTYMWLGNYPHGTDGGYWIPYFTGRQTNTETMLLPTDQVKEMKLIQERSSAIENYISGKGDLQSLCDNGLDYIYTGKGNTLSKAFDTLALQSDSLARLIYKNPGVMIFQICVSNSTQ